MSAMLGLFYLADLQTDLGTLTKHRCLASVPFGGRYRMIDFLLSSMVHAGVTNVGVFTNRKHRSLMDHLGTGKDWELDRKQDGLFLFPPDPLEESTDVSQFRANRDFFEKSPQAYVLLSYGVPVLNMNGKDLLNEHVKEEADVTQVTTMDGTPIDVFLMKKEVFLGLVDEAPTSIKAVLQQKDSNLSIHSYEHKGYVADLTSISHYYKASMDLLFPSIRKDLLNEKRHVYTKLKDDPATKYGSRAAVRHSFIADGCFIEGEVENCILFRGVHVKKGARLSNCIILQKSIIEEGASLRYCIIDKEVEVEARRRIHGSKDDLQMLGKKCVKQ